MNKKTVIYDIDLADPPALAARPDSEIDYSDIPRLTNDFWKNGVRGRFYRS